MKLLEMEKSNKPKGWVNLPGGVQKAAALGRSSEFWALCQCYKFYFPFNISIKSLPQINRKSIDQGNLLILSQMFVYGNFASRKGKQPACGFLTIWQAGEKHQVTG